MDAVHALARELIFQGKTNSQIFEILEESFGRKVSTQKLAQFRRERDSAQFEHIEDLEPESMERAMDEIEDSFEDEIEDPHEVVDSHEVKDEDEIDARVIVELGSPLRETLVTLITQMRYDHIHEIKVSVDGSVTLVAQLDFKLA